LALHNSATVTYIANEGVMIEAGGWKILIDALHRYYKDAYAYPPDDLRADLENAKGKFAEADLVLVSHIHGDHFSAESAGLHLLHNPFASLVSSPQVIDAVKRDFKDSRKFPSRLRTIPYEWKKQKSYTGNIRISFLGLRHANPQWASIQNFGHVIEIGGLKFLHVGDADMTDENFEAFRLNEAKIDVAFIPYWFLQSKDGRSLVDRQFGPRHIIAVHVPPAEANAIKKELEAYDPRIAVFSEPLETRTF
jgi:L-ascorbate metabolism protein UlaG (beta-lactamase superfamily)